LGGSAGPQLTGWRQEDAPQGPSAGPGCLTEAAGTAPPPGIAWPCLNSPLEQPVTTPPRTVCVTLVLHAATAHVPAPVTQQQQLLRQQRQQQQPLPSLRGPMLRARSHSEESAGHLPMEWPLEAVRQAHSAGPGCRMEGPGMEHPPGTVWQSQSFLLELPVTTV